MSCCCWQEQGKKLSLATFNSRAWGLGSVRNREKFQVHIRDPFFPDLHYLSLVWRKSIQPCRERDSRGVIVTDGEFGLSPGQTDPLCLGEVLSPGIGLIRMARLLPKIMSPSLKRNAIDPSLMAEFLNLLKGTHTHTHTHTRTHTKRRSKVFNSSELFSS